MRALCILHDSFSTTGLIGAGLRERGWTVDEVLIVPTEHYHSPNVKFTFPDHREYDLLVPMGAPWSAYDDEKIGAWLGPELDWLAEAAESGAAILGICFGAQALARALGGAVARLPAPEIGWYGIESAEPDLVGPGPWFQWHFDGFTPPPGAVTVARTALTPQAYRIGRCLGTQFHPEVTIVDVRMWLHSGGVAEARAHGIDPEDLVAECERQAAGARERTATLLDAYLATVFAG